MFSVGLLSRVKAAVIGGKLYVSFKVRIRLVNTNQGVGKDRLCSTAE